MSITGEVEESGKWKQYGTAIFIENSKLLFIGSMKGNNIGGYRTIKESDEKSCPWEVTLEVADAKPIENDDDQFVGTWELVRRSDGYTFLFSLKSDNTGFYSAGSLQNAPLVWEVDGDKLSIKSPPGKPKYVGFSYRIDGMKLHDDWGVSRGEYFTKSKPK